jgi:hypothetical protein
MDAPYGAENEQATRHKNGQADQTHQDRTAIEMIGGSS